MGRLSLILAAALALWATDFIHHVSPAWIALGAALLCLLPRVGILPPGAFNGEINYSSLFYVAGILGLGAVVAHSGLGDELARAVVETVGFVPGETGRNFAAMVLVTMAVALVATNPGVPAVMTPLAPAISEASGLGLETVLMSQVVGFSIFLLPYQTPPVIVGLHLGGVPVHRAIKLTLLLAAVSLIVLLPLNYLWWTVIGMFG
jgi:di/tricarboxylate transporter